MGFCQLLYYELSLFFSPLEVELCSTPAHLKSWRLIFVSGFLSSGANKNKTQNTKVQVCRLMKSSVELQGLIRFFVFVFFLELVRK